MRVRSGRNNQVGSHDEAGGSSGSVTLSLDPEDFDADQTLGFQPRVGQTFLQRWGSGHVPAWWVVWGPGVRNSWLPD